MVNAIDNGNPQAAAMVAMNNEYFYTTQLVNFFTPWSNVDSDAHQGLNDMTTTLIGMVRDNVGFDQALYGDILYVGSDSLVANTGGVIPAWVNGTYLGIPYNIINLQTMGLNSAGTARGNIRINLGTALQQKQQSALTGISDTAGVITTEIYGQNYFNAGTNRRVARFTFKNFLCMDMPQLADTTRPDFRVRRDVGRSPGGDSQVYKNFCVGCHAGMDAFAGAFAYFDYSKNAVTYTPGSVVYKMNKNNGVFPDGYTTTDDSWINLWTTGVDSSVGWNGASSGNGAKAFGKAISQTNQFSTCMVQQVFQMVCLRAPTSAEASTVQQLATYFSGTGAYNMKSLMAAVATLPQCMGN
jgi:hypothetical protein